MSLHVLIVIPDLIAGPVTFVGWSINVDTTSYAESTSEARIVAVRITADRLSREVTWTIGVCVRTV